MRLTLLQFVGLCDREELVEGVHTREVVAFAAIEKSALPNVNVEEAEERTERQTLREALEATALRDPGALYLVATSLAG